MGKVLRLTSEPLCHTPGIIKYAVAMYNTASSADDVKRAIDLFSSYQGLTLAHMELLVAGNYTVQDDTVLISLEDE